MARWGHLAEGVLSRTAAGAVLALVLAGGTSCDLFETRNPADPGGIRFPCVSLTAPDSLFINISRAYGRGDGLGCYLSTLGDTTFAFHADPTDSANSPSQFTSWPKAVEQVVAQNIATVSDPDYFFLQLKLPYTLVGSQPDVETRRYAYEIRFKRLVGASDTLFQGLAEITVRKGAGGQWQVEDWVDRRDPGGTTLLTWGYLRGSYRIGI